jgi:hypothetical protein
MVVNSKCHKIQAKAHLYMLENGISSLKFLHADAKDIFRHKLFWKKKEMNGDEKNGSEHE